MADDEITTDETEASEEAEGGSESQDGDGLGDKGRETLAKERKARRDAEKARKAAEKELADFKAAQQVKKDGDDATAAADQARRDAEQAADRRANERILRAELKAAAADALADPSDAAAFIDPSQFEPDANGEFDASEISEAISDLIKRKPHLAKKAQGFQGSGDGGARTGGSRKAQLTKADISKMTPVQIHEARLEGRLERYLSGE
jgi:hypothetical protein